MQVKRLNSYRAIGDFLRSNSGMTTAFDRPDVLRTVALIFDRKLMPLGFYKDSVLEGVALLVVETKGTLGIVQRLPTRYASMVSSPEAIPEHLGALRDYLAGKRIGKGFYSFSPWRMPDGHLLAASGCRVYSATGMVLPLHGPDVLGGAGRRVREAVRSTLRQGVNLRAATEEEMAGYLPSLLMQTYARHDRRSPYPREAPRVLWQRHHRDSDARLAVACLGGVPLGMMVTLAHGERAYTWILARDYSRAANLSINALLVRDAAEWAVGRGLSELDLGGGPPGIIEFKRRLGAHEVTYLEVECTHPRYAPFFGAWATVKAQWRQHQLINDA